MTEFKSAAQPWLNTISIMQQSVLFSAIRGPDGVAKHHKCKQLIRWYRRCVLLSAFEGEAITNPFAPGGGSFTGPVARGDLQGQYSMSDQLKHVVDDFMDSRDELPYHYTMHFMHAAEILGYKHPVPTIANFWHHVYARMAHSMHVWFETKDEMDARLGDVECDWRARGDESSTCSD